MMTLLKCAAMTYGAMSLVCLIILGAFAVVAESGQEPL
jgi:hypothetical protein